MIWVSFMLSAAKKIETNSLKLIKNRSSSIASSKNSKFYQFQDMSKVWNIKTHGRWRSSDQRCSVKKGVLKYFTNFTGKHLCWSLFQNCNFIEKRLWHRCFPMKFAKFLRTPTLKNICERLVLKMTFIHNDKDTNRSSRSQMIFKIGVVVNFAILTGKHLSWSLILWNDSNKDVFLWILRNF